MLRSIIAVSKDGYVAREEFDDMMWLGRTDKKIFRILTASCGIMATSKKTAALMPKKLDGRKLFTLSRKVQDGDFSTHNLDWFYDHYTSHEAWLIGGQELLLKALKEKYIGEIHICKSSNFAYPIRNMGIKDEITKFLQTDIHWNMAMATQLLDVEVQCWRFL